MVIGLRANSRPKEQGGAFLDWYNSPAEEFIMTTVLTEFFEREDIPKVGHNSGYYDRIVMRQRLGIDVRPNIDTMMLHRNVESELPHGLGYVASIYTEAPAWKTDREGNKLALGGESDKELHHYCARDVAITARVVEPLVSQLHLRQQEGVYRGDMKIQEICAAMHTTGMYVDQASRHKRELELLKTRHDLLEQIRSGVGIKGFNPVSVYQLRDLLFKDWDISTEFIAEKDRYTGSGDLSTGDLILRSLLTQGGIPEHQREIIKLIRRYRKCLKVLGTYVVKLRPSNMGADLGWDEDEDWLDRETRKKYGEIKRGIVNPATGRMYPGYNAHVAVTGRLSSSRPINAQNFPKALRSMVVPQPGNVLVGADMDQLELRIAAARWNVDLYLRAFEEGKDPHSMTAFAVFGDKFCEAAGMDPALFTRPGILVGDAYINGKFEGKGDAKAMRDLSKAVQYASQYMAAVETVHKLIQKTELPAVDAKTRKPIGDGTTDLPYARMALKKVRKMRDNWMKGAPQFESGWETEIGTFRDKGYLTEDVTGRRRDFLDGEAPNEIVNFPIQGSAAGLMNKSLIALYDAIPLHKWGPGTGIINQCHDAIVVECPEHAAKEVVGLLEECLNQTDPGMPGVRFTATAGIGKTWKEVG
jgi:DNA polymerase I-like protein with 3'-5' exonuclease and polymerase domains